MGNGPAIFLAHGASGDASSMRPYVKALEKRQLKASAIDLPVGKAERAVPVFIQKVPAGSIAGGHSFGGRVASMAATSVDYAALVCPGADEEAAIAQFRDSRSRLLNSRCVVNGDIGRERHPPAPFQSSHWP